ncbi:4'-phosphopantetheinyl transferase family protein [Fulvivirga kasyanovii]|uniref:4'-phosphopantetheinyl transferase superfamily protein n=1 Tax=Fulvivirga kasyanovii TaxID=396812 RepID=A0ABW9RRU6_9BACT|nr:4'-phosphopantetheinyl transferase superfamily protein [Fulvivirga kasyanovii]MTI26902.1 4'-phosphopantetheinyl transferase superfamily protein [Fulvivirga kasyanovii]
MIPTVHIFSTSFKEPLRQRAFSDYLSLLSPELREQNMRYLRWQNRHAHLFGRLLLIEALWHFGIEGDIWGNIMYNDYKRPYLTLTDYDFNISHSGDYVVCAIAKNVRLGIDIEENRKVNLAHFRNIMTPDQWEEINDAGTPFKTFYKYWTIKESVIKADGRGFYIPLDELEVKNNTVQFDGNLWFVNEVEYAHGYSAALATNQVAAYKFHAIDFYEADIATRLSQKLVQLK